MSTLGHVVICSPVLPEFDREAGSRRLFHHAEMLREAGWAVSYVTENPHGERRYVRALEEIGCAVYLGFGPQVDTLFALGQVDLAIIAFWYLAEQHMRRIRSLSPFTRVVIDSIDLHFLREARRLLRRSPDGALGAGLDAQYADQLTRELTVYSEADAVLTVSQKEADVVNDFVGDTGRAVHVVQAETISVSPVPARERRGLLFVGNFRHRPNRDALYHLLGDIVPKFGHDVLGRHPLTIVGNGLSDEDAAFAESHEHVRVVGWVPSLTPYYSQARVSLVPLSYGAGTKRKVIQSLMMGLPAVSTSVGVEGLDLIAGKHILVADDPSDFAEAVGRLLTDHRLWRRLSVEGAAAMTSSHGWERAKGQLVTLVEQLPTRSAPLLNYPGGVSPVTAYEAAVGDLRRWLHNNLPGDASVAVVSKGDENLLSLGGRRAYHLPGDGDGAYAGFHPGSSEDLLNEIAVRVAHGVDHLVVPASCTWWLEYYSGFRNLLSRDWVDLHIPDEMGHVFQLQLRHEDVDFQCNICGDSNQVPRAMIDRETPSCRACGSTPRSRSLVDALTRQLLGQSAVLSETLPRRQIRGLGLSDWDGYAGLLESLFDYRNTFLRSEPILDLNAPPPEPDGDIDFVVASEVFDHVTGEIELVLGNVRRMLKPGGLLVLTVPYTVDGSTVEYNDSSDDAGPTGGFVPARRFSLGGLRRALECAGYGDIVVHDDVNRDFGIWWSPRVSVPLSARAL